MAERRYLLAELFEDFLQENQIKVGLADKYRLSNDNEVIDSFAAFLKKLYGQDVMPKIGIDSNQQLSLLTSAEFEMRDKDALEKALGGQNRLSAIKQKLARAN